MPRARKLALAIPPEARCAAWISEMQISRKPVLCGPDHADLGFKTGRKSGRSDSVYECRVPLDQPHLIDQRQRLGCRTGGQDLSADHPRPTRRDIGRTLPPQEASV